MHWFNPEFPALSKKFLFSHNYYSTENITPLIINSTSNSIRNKGKGFPRQLADTDLKLNVR